MKKNLLNRLKDRFEAQTIESTENLQTTKDQLANKIDSEEAQLTKLQKELESLQRSQTIVEGNLILQSDDKDLRKQYDKFASEIDFRKKQIKKIDETLQARKANLREVNSKLHINEQIDLIGGYFEEHRDLYIAVLCKRKIDKLAGLDSFHSTPSDAPLFRKLGFSSNDLSNLEVLNSERYKRIAAIIDETKNDFLIDLENEVEELFAPITKYLS